VFESLNSIPPGGRQQHPNKTPPNKQKTEKMRSIFQLNVKNTKTVLFSSEKDDYTENWEAYTK
jgi:hypothetical protein